jgi:hypothetical protein
MLLTQVYYIVVHINQKRTKHIINLQNVFFFNKGCFKIIFILMGNGLTREILVLTQANKRLASN